MPYMLSAYGRPLLERMQEAEMLPGPVWRLICQLCTANRAAM